MYEGKTYSATVPLTVISLPANVSFTALDDYYVVDTVGSVDISWIIDNFAHFSADDGLFEMRIGRTGGGENFGPR